MTMWNTQQRPPVRQGPYNLPHTLWAFGIIVWVIVSVILDFATAGWLTINSRPALAVTEMIGQVAILAVILLRHPR
jgi:hypothetical protein